MNAANWGDPRLPTRFWSKVQPEPNSGCWIWTGAATPNGYGVIGRGRRGQGNILAHRKSFEALAGVIPVGLHLDHLCHTTLCCNPAHLEPVTQAENNRRARARVTQCSKGHPYSDANTYLYRGQRDCRACNNEQAKRRNAARRAA